MPSLLDRDMDRRGTTGEQLCGEALMWLRQPYSYGDKTAEALDGAYGTKFGHRGIDCSGFVVSVYQYVLKDNRLDKEKLNVQGLRVSTLFKRVETPEKGDIICWLGHCGIVLDPVLNKFIGAQGHDRDGHVEIADYGLGY